MTPTKTPSPTKTPIPTETPIPVPQVKVSVETANIRKGPGTGFDSAGIANENDVYDVEATNRDGTWYLVSKDGLVIGWIASSVVTVVDSNAMDAVAVAVTIPAPPTPQPTAIPATLPPTIQPTATTETAPEPGKVIIIWVDKKAEYVDLQNIGGTPVDLTGWTLVSEKGNQACALGTTIQPGDVLRVWALAEDANQGGYNCGFGSPIWNNSESDPAVLYDPNGVEVSRR